MGNLPDIVNKINKEKKNIKITTLGKAKSFNVKRFTSGSFAIDSVIGGGYAFRRMHMLFGAKSSGKNANLYQTIAYNQRLCRHCGGILPDFIKQDTSSNIILGVDRWSDVLINYMDMPACGCGKSHGRIALFLDYEKSLGIETPKPKFIKNIVHSKTGEIIDEDNYDAVVEEITIIKSKKEMTEEDKHFIKDKEKWIKELKIDTVEVPMLSSTEYLDLCGVITDELLVSDPADAEEGTNYLKEIIPSQEVDIIVIDSLQAMLPKYVKDRDAEDATMGAESKANGLCVRQICAAYAAINLEDEREAYKPAVFFNSQIRSSLGGFSGSQPTFSGGHAVAHNMSLILEFKREKYLKEDGTEASFKDMYYGQQTRIRVEKNKLAAPGGFANYNYYFRAGEFNPVGQIDHVDEITTMGIERGLIERAGAYYRVNGEQFQGMKALVEYMRANSKFVGEVIKKIINV